MASWIGLALATLSLRRHGRSSPPAILPFSASPPSFTLAHSRIEQCPGLLESLDPMCPCRLAKPEAKSSWLIRLLPMLPRHLRRTVPAHTAYRLLATPSCQHAPPLAGLRYRPTAGPVATFHHTPRWNDELPKSPFQTFVDILKKELRKKQGAAGECEAAAG